MTDTVHELGCQAAGLAKLFAGTSSAINTVSVLSAPGGADSHKWALALADALTACNEKVCLVQAHHSTLSVTMGYRPMRRWQMERTLDSQLLHAGAYPLLYAPDSMAGDAKIIDAVAKNGRHDFLLFDGGRFSRSEAQINPHAVQTLVVLTGEQDVETAYALCKGLDFLGSPAELFFVGGACRQLAQLISRWQEQNLGECKIQVHLCRNNNNQPETSSDTLTINPNLSWIVSRIRTKNHKRVANGGVGKGAQQIDQG